MMKKPFRTTLVSSTNEINLETFANELFLAGHCLNMLRMVLMCNIDTGVHPFVWAKDSHNASTPAHVFPDFQRNHQCKNFDAILDYTKMRKSLARGKLDIYPQKDSLILPDWP